MKLAADLGALVASSSMTMSPMLVSSLTRGFVLMEDLPCGLVVVEDAGAEAGQIKDSPRQSVRLRKIWRVGIILTSRRCWIEDGLLGCPWRTMILKGQAQVYRPEFDGQPGF